MFVITYCDHPCLFFQFIFEIIFLHHGQTNKQLKYITNLFTSQSILRYCPHYTFFIHHISMSFDIWSTKWKIWIWIIYSIELEQILRIQFKHYTLLQLSTQRYRLSSQINKTSFRFPSQEFTQRFNVNYLSIANQQVCKQQKSYK